MDQTDRYGGARIRRGLWHFLAGKALTSVAGIGTFILLIRALPIDAFAAYSILFGLVELIGAITGVGITHVMSRYVPEVYATHQNRTFKVLVLRLLALRTVVLGIAIVLLWIFAPELGQLIGLAGWDEALRLYLWVIAIRTILLTLFTLLEQMLLQGIAQLGLSLVTGSRFLILAALWWAGELDLRTVIWVEIITDTLGVVIMLAGLSRNMPAGANTADASVRQWLRDNRARMVDFGWKGYMQHMLVLPFSGATDRLIIGSQLAAGPVALFGFGQWILDLMNRYLPAQLLQGMIRPVLTARYVRSGSFADVVFMSNLILKINLVLLALFAVVTFAGGEQAIAWLTADKYGAEALLLLLLMTFLMALYSWRQVLDIAAHVVEKNGPLIWAHSVLVLSVIPGVLALPWLGVYALPVSHVAGVIIACALLIHRLAREGFVYQMAWKSLALMMAAMLATMAITTLMRDHLPWPVTCLAAVLVFLALWALSKPIDTAERRALTEMVKRRASS